MIVTNELLRAFDVCDSAYDLYDGVLPLTWKEAYQHMSDNPPDDPELAEWWKGWMVRLKNNPRAVRYDGNFELVEEYKVIYNGVETLHSTWEDAEKQFDKCLANYRKKFRLDPVMVQKTNIGLKYYGTNEMRRADDLEYEVTDHNAVKYLVTGWEAAREFADQLTDCWIKTNNTPLRIMGKIRSTTDGTIAWEPIDYEGTLHLPNQRWRNKCRARREQI